MLNFDQSSRSETNGHHAPGPRSPGKAESDVKACNSANTGKNDFTGGP